MAESDFSKQQTIRDFKINSNETLPEKIGPYLIEALIAKSAHSLLYLGYESQTRQLVALKVLHPEGAKTEAMVHSFIQEGQMINMASHPNIVKLYGQGEWEGGFYLAMEFIRGISLRQFIQQQSLSLKRSLDIILQVSYALCHLHVNGIIHGDLKPENILIAEDGEIKVVDFGIAKLHNHPHDQMKLAGTPSYMSPEHKENIHNLTYSSDIYSLGVIAYELLIGKLSFGVVHLEKVQSKIRPILSRCLEKDLSKRYSDVVDLIHDLTQYLKSKDLDTEINEKQPVLHLEEAFQEALRLQFPIPELNLEAIDLGFSRKFFEKEGSCPLIGKILTGDEVLLGLFEAEGPLFQKSLHESYVLGLIHMLITQSDPKKFNFAQFCEKLNTLCFESKIHIRYSFILLNRYMDELTLCYGGFLAPLLLKNQKLTQAPVSLTNVAFGYSLESPIIGNHSLGLSDQCILHPLHEPKSVKSLGTLLLSHSLYSAQNLSDTLLKKTPSASSLISCIKVK